jgi:hypothetical protein
MESDLVTGDKEVNLKFDYCGVCPYLGQLILCDDRDMKGDHETIIYCKDFHGIGMEIFGRKLTHKEWENIPDWCTQLPYKEE